MDDLLRKLKAYSRFLELEDSIPYWEHQKQEHSARISEMQRNLQKKEQLYLDLEGAAFLSRFLRSAGGRGKKLSEQIRQIEAACTAAQWELESLDRKISAGRLERESLLTSRTAYENAKAKSVLTAAQESMLLLEEISAFAPAALATAERLLETLTVAEIWMEPGQINKEFLQDVAMEADRLANILSVLPEGVTSVHQFLCAPHDYLNGVNQRDLLRQAQEQTSMVINQLRLLLGE